MEKLFLERRDTKATKAESNKLHMLRQKIIVCSVYFVFTVSLHTATLLWLNSSVLEFEWRVFKETELRDLNRSETIRAENC